MKIFYNKQDGWLVHHNYPENTSVFFKLTGISVYQSNYRSKIQKQRKEIKFILKEETNYETR